MSHDRAWVAAAYLYALLAAAVVAYLLLGITIQVSDSFGNLLALQQQTLAQLVLNQFYSSGYLRPLLWAQFKVVYEIADGNYFLVFRTLHAAQAMVLIILCVRLMRPRTAIDAALVPLGLAVLIGAHTFAPTVREAFPINAFLTVMVCCAAVANLALAPAPRRWADLLAVALLGFMLLTVETGLLVWFVGAALWTLGAKGLSRGAIVSMTALVAAYVVVRMVILDVGGPSLSERASGFGFGVLEPGQLVERFGSAPWTFYLYNVTSSVATVLFSEPKGGIWRFVYELTVADVHPWTAVSVLSSTLAAATIGWFIWTRRHNLRRWSFDDDDRRVLLFVGVLGANAVMSYPYTKNAIMSPAGVFLAVAVVVAARRLLSEVSIPRRKMAAIAVCVLLSAGWAVRVAGLHYNLRRTAMLQRNEWVQVDDWLSAQRITLDDVAAHALRDRLRADAIYNHPTPPQPPRQWLRWFDLDW